MICLQHLSNHLYKNLIMNTNYHNGNLLMFFSINLSHKSEHLFWPHSDLFFSFFGHPVILNRACSLFQPHSILTIETHIFSWLNISKMLLPTLKFTLGSKCLREELRMSRVWETGLGMQVLWSMGLMQELNHELIWDIGTFLNFSAPL